MFKRTITKGENCTNFENCITYISCTYFFFFFSSRYTQSYRVLLCYSVRTPDIFKIDPRIIQR